VGVRYSGSIATERPRAPDGTERDPRRSSTAIRLRLPLEPARDPGRAECHGSVRAGPCTPQTTPTRTSSAMRQCERSGLARCHKLRRRRSNLLDEPRCLPSAGARRQVTSPNPAVARSVRRQTPRPRAGTPIPATSGTRPKPPPRPPAGCPPSAVLAAVVPPIERRGPAGGDETVRCQVSGLRYGVDRSNACTKLFEPVEWVSRREPVVGSTPIQR